MSCSHKFCAVFNVALCMDLHLSTFMIFSLCILLQEPFNHLVNSYSQFFILVLKLKVIRLSRWLPLVFLSIYSTSSISMFKSFLKIFILWVNSSWECTFSFVHWVVFCILSSFYFVLILLYISCTALWFQQLLFSNVLYKPIN